MTNRATKALHINATVMLVLLVLQYVLGMAANLFIQFPQNADNAGQLWEFAWSQPLIAVHIITGFLLLVGAIALVVEAIRNKNRSWIIFSLVGLLAILIAGGSGAIFIPTQSNVYSYTMSLAFIVAFLTYGWGLTATKSSISRL